MVLKRFKASERARGLCNSQNSNSFKVKFFKSAS
jgi:hypothetical protein